MQLLCSINILQDNDSLFIYSCFAAVEAVFFCFFLKKEGVEVESRS